jgi:heptosyltransferase-2
LGPDERDLLEELERLWPDKNEWRPITADLETTSACLARLAAVLTNDSGLMHAAAAVGTPVVAIFGPTVRSFGFTPVGEGHLVLEARELGCRPCSLHGGPRCPRGHFHCMLEVTPEMAWNALETVSAGAAP